MTIFAPFAKLANRLMGANPAADMFVRIAMTLTKMYAWNIKNWKKMKKTKLRKSSKSETASRYITIPFKKLASTKAWKLTSELVRLKSKGICYTCGKWYPFKKLHCGHLIEKIGNAIIYFDLDGLRAQCYRCNRLLHGNKDIFGQKLRKEIGEERVNNLYKKINKTKVWNKSELEKIAADRKMDLIDYDIDEALKE